MAQGHFGTKPYINGLSLPINVLRNPSACFLPWPEGLAVYKIVRFCWKHLVQPLILYMRKGSHLYGTSSCTQRIFNELLWMFKKKPKTSNMNTEFYSLIQLIFILDN